jgi:hypothetical protein
MTSSIHGTISYSNTMDLEFTLPTLVHSLHPTSGPCEGGTQLTIHLESLDLLKDYYYDDDKNSPAMVKLRFKIKGDDNAKFVDIIPHSVKMASNLVHFRSPSSIECTSLNTRIMTSLAISYNNGSSYEHLNGISFYYYKQPLVTSIRPARIIVDSDTGVVLTSTNLEFSISADNYYCMLIGKINGITNKFRVIIMSDTELLCQIDSNGLDTGDYILSLSANGLNGDYRRISDDDTQFITIIEDYSSMECIPNTVNSKGGTEVLLIAPSFTDMTGQTLGNDSPMSLKNVKIELRPALSNLSNSTSKFVSGSYKHVSLARVVNDTSLAFKMPSWSYESEQTSHLFDEIEVLLYHYNELHFKSSLTIVTDSHVNSLMIPTTGHFSGGTRVSIMLSDLYLVQDCDLVARVRPVFDSFSVDDGDQSKESFIEISMQNTDYDHISSTLSFTMPPYTNIVAGVENNITTTNLVLIDVIVRFQQQVGVSYLQHFYFYDQSILRDLLVYRFLPQMEYISLKPSTLTELGGPVRISANTIPSVSNAICRMTFIQSLVSIDYQNYLWSVNTSIITDDYVVCDITSIPSAEGSIKIEISYNEGSEWDYVGEIEIHPMKRLVEVEPVILPKSGNSEICVYNLDSRIISQINNSHARAYCSFDLSVSSNKYIEANIVSNSDNNDICCCWSPLFSEIGESSFSLALHDSDNIFQSVIIDNIDIRIHDDIELQSINLPKEYGIVILQSS